ncbi:hypothetical protein [Planktothrix pseudagardhii]|uniref:Uncharacterized protein n=1 Tax=Planktothrix pseudagardhii TaxID=132604 RepID=A0A9W4D9W2_9CYAN|nr:hypothetical protein [Planktothrix pseudagardhii]CAD5968020.1 hypothetical protein NO713_03634 [Planktothrix pseudagardhii]
MTELLRQAIAQIEKLPPDQQDAIAAWRLSVSIGKQIIEKLSLRIMYIRHLRKSPNALYRYFWNL